MPNPRKPDPGPPVLPPVGRGEYLPQANDPLAASRRRVAEGLQREQQQMAPLGPAESDSDRLADEILKSEGKTPAAPLSDSDRLADEVLKFEGKRTVGGQPAGPVAPAEAVPSVPTGPRPPVPDGGIQWGVTAQPALDAVPPPHVLGPVYPYGVQPRKAYVIPTEDRLAATRTRLATLAAQAKKQGVDPMGVPGYAEAKNEEQLLLPKLAHTFDARVADLRKTADAVEADKKRLDAQTKLANAGKLTPDQVAALKSAIAQHTKNVQGLDLRIRQIGAERDRYGQYSTQMKALVARVKQGGFDQFPEERALNGKPSKFEQSVAHVLQGGLDFFTPATTDADHRRNLALMDLALKGQYPPLPSLGEKLSPIPAGGLGFDRSKWPSAWRKVNEADDLRIQMSHKRANVGEQILGAIVGGLSETTIDTLKLPAPRELDADEKAKLTPWQQKLYPIIRQQLLAEAKADLAANHGGALLTDLGAGVAGEIVGGAAANGVFRRIVGNSRYLSWLAEPLFEKTAQTALSKGGAAAAERSGASLGSKLIRELLVKPLPVIASGAAGGAAGAPVGAALTELGQGNLDPKEIGKRAAGAVLPGAVLGGGLAAGSYAYHALGGQLATGYRGLETENEIHALSEEVGQHYGLDEFETGHLQQRLREIAQAPEFRKHGLRERLINDLDHGLAARQAGGAAPEAPEAPPEAPPSSGGTPPPTEPAPPSKPPRRPGGAFRPAEPAATGPGAAEIQEPPLPAANPTAHEPAPPPPPAPPVVPNRGVIQMPPAATGGLQARAEIPLHELTRSELDQLAQQIQASGKDLHPDDVRRLQEWASSLDAQTAFGSLEGQPPQVLDTWRARWGASADQFDHRVLSTHAQSLEEEGPGQDPRTAALLRYAAAQTARHFAFDFNAGNTEPDLVPPTFAQEPSAWRRLDPERRDALPAVVARTLLEHDLRRSHRMMGQYGDDFLPELSVQMEQAARDPRWGAGRLTRLSSYADATYDLALRSLDEDLPGNAGEAQPTDLNGAAAPGTDLTSQQVPEAANQGPSNPSSSSPGTAGIQDGAMASIDEPGRGPETGGEGPPALTPGGVADFINQLYGNQGGEPAAGLEGSPGNQDGGAAAALEGRAPAEPHQVEDVSPLAGPDDLKPGRKFRSTKSGATFEIVGQGAPVAEGPMSTAAGAKPGTPTWRVRVVEPSPTDGTYKQGEEVQLPESELTRPGAYERLSTPNERAAEEASEPFPKGSQVQFEANGKTHRGTVAKVEPEHILVDRPGEGQARVHKKNPTLKRVTERRQDTATRKRIEEMDLDEARQALGTDDLTGVGNRRAWAEVEKKKHLAALDADGLKWVNDHLGHPAGDDLLRAIAQALSDAGLDAYHISGDEFWTHHDDGGALDAALRQVQDRLAQAKIIVETTDGKTFVHEKGIGFSYGIGENEPAAEGQLSADKALREQAGLRAGRGEAPPDLAARARKRAGGEAPGRPAEGGTAAEVRPVGAPDVQPRVAEKEAAELLRNLGFLEETVNPPWSVEIPSPPLTAETPARERKLDWGPLRIAVIPSGNERLLHIELDHQRLTHNPSEVDPLQLDAADFTIAPSGDLDFFAFSRQVDGKRPGPDSRFWVDPAQQRVEAGKFLRIVNEFFYSKDVLPEAMVPHEEPYPGRAVSVPGPNGEPDYGVTTVTHTTPGYVHTKDINGTVGHFPRDQVKRFYYPGDPNDPEGNAAKRPTETTLPDGTTVYPGDLITFEKGGVERQAAIKTIGSNGRALHVAHGRTESGLVMVDKVLSVEPAPWRQRYHEYRETPDAVRVPASSILHTDLSKVHPETFAELHPKKELVQLAIVLGSPTSGTKSQIVARAKRFYEMRLRLKDETLDTLLERPRKELEPMVRALGLYIAKNKRGLAVGLLNWRQKMRNNSRSQVAKAKHFYSVEEALQSGLPVPAGAVKDHPYLWKEYQSRYAGENPEADRRSLPEPWEMTREEFQEAYPTEDPASHRAHVQRAIQSNEPVPAEVAAEYPDVVESREPLPVKGEGGTARVTTPVGGMKVEIRYAVVDARDLITSHTDEGTENPDFPQELQPRDRSKKSSREWIAATAQQLDPDQLGADPMADGGAPIVGPEGYVESGNGRSLALRAAYAQNLPSGGRYRAWLHGALRTQFGFEHVDELQAKQVEQPVLVRIRTTELDPQERIKFVQLANKPVAAAMSATEKATSDASFITPAMMALFNPDESGDLLAASNRDFMRAFISAFAPTERGALVDAQGRISLEGMQRIRNAIFQRAYEDAHALNRLAEATNDPIRNVTVGMLNASRWMIELNDGIYRQTVRKEYALAADLAAVNDALARIRDQKQTVAQYLQQNAGGNLLGEGLTPLQRAILIHFDANKRSARKIQGVLTVYADKAMTAGDPRSASLFGEDFEPPTQEEIWQAAVNKVEGQVSDEPDLFTAAAAAEPGPAGPSVADLTHEAGGDGAPGPGSVPPVERPAAELAEEPAAEVAGAAPPPAEPSQPSQPPEIPGLAPGMGDLVSLLHTKLRGGQALGNKTDLRKFATVQVGSGKYSMRDAYDALEAAIVRWLKEEGVPQISQIGTAHGPGAAIHALETLMGRVPTQDAGDRTREQEEFQQFSTPPTIAYVAFQAFDHPDVDLQRAVFLEPSAGTGMLAVWPAGRGARVHANEISDRRAALLRLNGFDVTMADGEWIDNTLDAGIQPHAVFMNPPFSATGGRVSRTSSKFGMRHIEQALTRLQPGGRLVAIMSEGIAFGKSPSAEFWARILKRYSVRANFSLPREAYRKMGTTYPVQVVVIDKTGPTADRAAIVTGAKTLEEAADALKKLPAWSTDGTVRASEAGHALDAAGEPGTGLPDPAPGAGTGQHAGGAGEAPAGGDLHGQPDRSGAGRRPLPAPLGGELTPDAVAEFIGGLYGEEPVAPPVRNLGQEMAEGTQALADVLRAGENYIAGLPAGPVASYARALLRFHVDRLVHGIEDGTLPNPGTDWPKPFSLIHVRASILQIVKPLEDFEPFEPSAGDRPNPSDTVRNSPETPAPAAPAADDLADLKKLAGELADDLFGRGPDEPALSFVPSDETRRLTQQLASKLTSDPAFGERFVSLAKQVLGRAPALDDWNRTMAAVFEGRLEWDKIDPRVQRFVFERAGGSVVSAPASPETVAGGEKSPEPAKTEEPPAVTQTGDQRPSPYDVSKRELWQGQTDDTVDPAHLTAFGDLTPGNLRAITGERVRGPRSQHHPAYGSPWGTGLKLYAQIPGQEGFFPIHHWSLPEGEGGPLSISWGGRTADGSPKRGGGLTKPPEGARLFVGDDTENPKVREPGSAFGPGMRPVPTAAEPAAPPRNSDTERPGGPVSGQGALDLTGEVLPSEPASQPSGLATATPQAPAATPQAEPEAAPPIQTIVVGQGDAEALKQRKEESGGTFVTYVPQKLAGGKPHPGNIVETAAMAAVSPPDIKYVDRLPEAVVRDGRISALQYESVLYAGQRHMVVADDGKRLGYFVGDGTGVGKGREIAAISLDNWMHSRKRIVWISFKRELAVAAREDLDAVAGADPEVPLTTIYEHNNAQGGGYPAIAEKMPEGVLFLSYHGLIGKSRESATGRQHTRLQQIVDWNPDVIIFDESHMAKNALVVGRGDPSQMGRAVMDIQEALPNTRIVYSSATGMTDTRNMAYMTRLKLWGPGTAFPDFNQFLQEVEGGGVGMQEMIAREAKALGMYTSRSISFEGVDYDQVVHELEPWQEQMYDAAAEFWQHITRQIEAGLQATNAHGTAAQRQIQTQYWGTHQRFFRQVLTAMKVPTIIQQTEHHLAMGNAVVIGLIGTGESRTETKVAKAISEQTDLEDLDFSPRDTMAAFVGTQFPIEVWTETEDDGGRTIKTPALDSEGNQQVSQEALRLRERLLELIGQIHLPDNPLDQVINHFGPDKVAEMTGRKRRLVTIGGKREYRPRNEGMRAGGRRVSMANVNVEEMRAFQDGRKFIAVISDASSTGISLHASREAGNQRRRVHMTLELGWSADRQMQSFGRTHRTNQASAPFYLLVSTNAGGETRFASTIARRLASLGALTKGQRDATAGGEIAKYNFETIQGEAAAFRTLNDLAAIASYGPEKLPELGEGPVEDGETTALSPMLEMRGLDHGPIAEMTRRQAADTLLKMGIVRADPETGELPGHVTIPTSFERDVPRFLNRVLALDLRTQNAVYGQFFSAFQSIVENAKEEGSFDAGITDLKGLGIEREKAPTVVHTDPISGAETHHHVLKVTREVHPVSFQRVQERIDERGRDNRQPKPGFYRQKRSRQIAFLDPANPRTDIRTGQQFTPYYVTSPSTWKRELIREAELLEKYERVDPKQARDEWDEAVKALPKTRTSETHLLAGALLPIWDRLRAARGEKLEVVRATTDSGERIVGLLIPERAVPQVLAQLGITGSVETPEQVYHAILDGGRTLTLVNGARLLRGRYGREARLEIDRFPQGFARELIRLGFQELRIDYRYRYFAPMDEAGAADVIKRVLERWPIQPEETVTTETSGPGQLPIGPDTRGPALSFVPKEPAKPTVAHTFTPAPVPYSFEHRSGSGPALYSIEPKPGGDPFYSALARAIDTKMGGRMPAPALRAMLKANGVKDAELKWTGLDDFLSAAPGPVSKAEVQNWLAAHQVQLVETTPTDLEPADRLDWNDPDPLSPDQSWVDQLAEDHFDQARDQVLDEDPSYYEQEPAALDRDAREKARELASESAWEDADLEYRDSAYGYRIVSNQPGDHFIVYAPDEHVRDDQGRYLRKEPGKAFELDFDKFQDADDAAQADAHERFGRKKEETRFGDYTHGDHAPGYRELLLTIPNLRPAATANHWDVPNVLVHIRMSARLAPDGKRVLFLEEIQSDWFQKLRDHGARGPQHLDELDALYKERARLEARLRTAAGNLTKQYAELDASRESLGTSTQVRWGDPQPTPEQEARARAIGEEMGALSQRINALQMPIREELTQVNERIMQASQRQPEGPFSKTDEYAALALKRMLRYAAEQGFEHLAWATAEMNADIMGHTRYVDALEWEPTKDGRGILSAYQKDTAGVVLRDKPSFREELRESDLPAYIGEPTAKDLLEKRWLGSDEYKVQPNEGMRLFYDRILPQEANRFAKKWGGQVGTVQVSNGSEKQVGWRYDGPDVTLDQVKAKLADTSWQMIAPTRFGLLSAVFRQMAVGQTFREVIANINDQYGARQGVAMLWGGQVEPVFQANRFDVPGISLTPAMREGIVTEGFPLFNAQGNPGEFPRERLIQAWAGIRRGPLDVLDYEGKLADADVRELWGNPWMRQFAPVMRNIYARFSRRLLSPAERGRVRHVGLGFIPRPDGWVLGVNFPDVAGGNGAQGIFVDPFAPLSLPHAGDYGPDELARTIVLTLVHEMAHVVDRGEGESFLQVLDRFHGTLGSDFDRAVEGVARTLRGATNAATGTGPRSGGSDAAAAGRAFADGYEAADLWHRRAFGVPPAFNGGDQERHPDVPGQLEPLPPGLPGEEADPGGPPGDPRLGGAGEPGGLRPSEPGDPARGQLHPAGPRGGLGGREAGGGRGIGTDRGADHGAEPALSQVTPDVARVDQALRDAFGHSAGATVARRLGVRAARNDLTDFASWDAAMGEAMPSLWPRLADDVKRLAFGQVLAAAGKTETLPLTPPAAAGGGGPGTPPPPRPPRRPTGYPAGDGFEFDRPELETQYQESRGVRAAGLMEKVGEWANRLWNISTREWEHLPRAGQHAQLRHDLNWLRTGRETASGMALMEMADLARQMNPEQEDLFNRCLVINDLVEEVQVQLQRDPDAGEDAVLLPEPWTIADVLTEQARLDMALDEPGNEHLRELVDRRRETMHRIRDEYLDAMEAATGHRTEMTRRDYFRHQVLAHLELEPGGENWIKGPGKKVQAPMNRGFLKQRRGSELAYNTDWIQAEHEVLGQMLYDTRVFRLLQHVQEHYDIKGRLKWAAIEQNKAEVMPFFQALADAWNARPIHPGQDPGEPKTADQMFRSILNWQQARGFEELGELAADGMLPDTPTGEWADVIEQLREQYQFGRANEADDPMAGGLQFDDDFTKRVLAYAAWVIRTEGGSPASGSAAGIFRGIRAKREFLKEKLGRDFATYKDLIPEGYVEWQPRTGNVVFRAWSIPERVYEHLIAGTLDEIGGLSPDQVRQIRALGPRRPGIVIPAEVATTLDNFGRGAGNEDALAWMDRSIRGVVNGWKQIQLLGPQRAILYNVRNATGDAEHVQVGNMDSFRCVPRAWRELTAVVLKRELPSGDLRDWIERGGFSSLVTTADRIGSALGTGLERRLTGDNPGAIRRAYEGYWKAVRVPTDLREAVLRYASYLSYLDQLAAAGNRGRPENYGASIPEEIDALEDPRDKAYHLANDLLGAYDEITVGGRWLRERVFPFWSWKEANAKFYYRMLRNTLRSRQAQENAGRAALGEAAKRASPFILARVGQFVLKALWAMYAAWNWTMHRKEEESLPPEIRGRAHLVLGSDPKTGRVNYIGRIGAVSDLLAWFGADEAPYYVEAWGNGRMSLGEIAREMALEPANELAQSTGPYKTAAEFALGREAYPSIYRPRVIRDRYEFLARAVGLDVPYRLVTGKPSRGLVDIGGRYVSNVIDPEEATYNEVVGLRYDFLRKRGMGDGGSEPNPRSNALYYHKMALRYGDRAAAARYLLEYVKLGGTERSYDQGLRSLHPLAGLTGGNEEDFLSRLSREDQGRLRRAVAFYAHLVAPDAQLPGAGDVPELRPWIRTVNRLVNREIGKNTPVRDLLAEHPDLKPARPAHHH